MKSLITNADDFGLAPSVNEAIIECLEARRLSSTTLMVNGPNANEALGWARANPQYAIGLHVNLAHFSPISDVPGLTRRGCFRGLGGLAMHQLADSEGLYQLAKLETAAQLSVFQSATGRLPSHVDSHLWAQALPAIFRAILDVASSHGIAAMRNIEETDILRAFAATLRIGGLKDGNVWRSMYQSAKACWLTHQSRWCRYTHRLRAAGMFSPDRYFGVSEGLLYLDTSVRLRAVASRLEVLPANTVAEFMVHPGGDAAPDGVWYHADHARIEAQTLLSNQFMDLLHLHQVQLLEGYGPSR